MVINCEKLKPFSVKILIVKFFLVAKLQEKHYRYFGFQMWKVNASQMMLKHQYVQN